MLLNDLFESLPLSVAKDYTKNNVSNVYDSIFNRFEKYGRGKTNPQRLYFPMPQRSGKSVSSLGYNELKDSDLKWSFSSDIQYIKRDCDIDDIALKELLNSKICKSIEDRLRYLSNISYDEYKKGIFIKDNKPNKIGKVLNDLYLFLEKVEKLLNTDTLEHNLENIKYNKIEAKRLLDIFSSDSDRHLKNDSFYVVISRLMAKIYNHQNFC